MRHWTPLSEDEYKNVWNRFDSEFIFRPSIHPENWPSIAEPHPSITYAIDHCFEDPVRYEELTGELNRKLLQVLRAATRYGDQIYALDWQHESYLYSPHQEPELHEGVECPIPFLPNGDYYIHISKDFSYGIFGHPWEQTMCVFGSKLLKGLSSNLPEAFNNVVRLDGKLL